MTRLRRLRLLRGLTQKALARKIGVSPPQISAYESMDYQPREKIKTRLALFFNVQPETLFEPDSEARRVRCVWCGRFILIALARFIDGEPERPYCCTKCIEEDLDTRGYDEARYVPRASPPAWPPSGHDVTQKVRRVDVFLPGVEG